MAEQIIIILAGISLLIIIPKLLAARRLNSELKQKYGKIIDLEEERDRIDRQNKKLSTDIENRKTAWEKDFSEAAEELAQLQEKLETARDQEHMQSFGLYEAHYDFESSVGYKAKLDQIRAQQKDLVKRKIAAVCDEEWTMQGSRAKGRQMEQRYLRLLLRAFNGECDSIVFKVNYRNITAMEQRVSRSFDALNKLGESQYCRITPEYLDLKISEIRLVHEFQEKKQAEKEEQRLIREQMREEERARREAEKAQAEAEREERRYESALEKARRELQRAGDDKRTELEREIERLQEQLEEAHQNKERAISRAQLTKSGHVYIISNIGSFGENIYKIGLTRRLDPDDRIKELGDASVPFPFDVHAMIYSEGRSKP